MDARGLELDAGNVAAAVARGLSVIQGDADTDLADYPDDDFDYAILSQTLQTTRAPDVVLDHLVADRPPRLRLVPQFRALAGAAVAAVGRADAGDAAAARTMVLTRPISTTSRSTISARSSRGGASTRRGGAWFLAGRPSRPSRPVAISAPNTRCSCCGVSQDLTARNRAMTPTATSRPCACNGVRSGKWGTPSIMQSEPRGDAVVAHQRDTGVEADAGIAR